MLWKQLTDIGLFGAHDRQVQVAVRCELGVYCWLNLQVAVSHNLRTPSGLEYKQYSPFDEKDTGAETAIFNTCFLMRMCDFFFFGF